MNAGHRLGVWLLVPAVLIASTPARGGALARNDGNEIAVEMVERVVELSTDGGKRWIRIQANQILRTGDRVRTGQNSRAALRVSASTVLSFGALSEIEILPPEATGMEPGLHFFRGILSFFHKDRPGRIRVISPGGEAGIDGTEFVMIVDTLDGKERTTLALLDGIVNFGNERKTLRMTDGEQVLLETGGIPVRIAGFVANNVLQWAFYYPAVLDTRDLSFSPEEERALNKSLAAYHSGNLLSALDEYGERDAHSEAEQLYRAALLLAVGQVSQTVDALALLEQGNVSPRARRLVAALRQQISAVKRESWAITNSPELTTELLAASYYEQSLAGGDMTLKRALGFARDAATNSPDFGFAWARVAELEFSFGRIDKANDALNKSLALSPSNAQAVALSGFLLAAQNKPRDAMEWFDRALAMDSALANAWLGRGLCRIRLGESAGGRADLLMAAALEPRRAELRSYLGKAYSDSGDTNRALHELNLAQDIDPKDPTAWFYSALAKAKQNRVNEAIRDLEHSQVLNNNRRVYRSQLLLDQDRAVRSADLALLYADANLADVAVREAGRAVTADYANYSSHLFLANSYEAQRRANLSNLRFETAAISESMVASLLGPASGTLLAQQVMQLQPSRTIERDGFGIIANTEYFDRGAWRHSSAQFGTFGPGSYSLEAEYVSDPGERRNQDFEIQQLEAKVKYDLTPQDSVLLHVRDYRSSGGDTLQHFDESDVDRGFRFEQEQTPTLFAGYHHQWSPQHHTLALAGRVDDTLRTEDSSGLVYVLDRRGGTIQTNGLAPVLVQNQSRSRVEVYFAEAQQVATLGRQTLILGGRLEFTEQDVQNHVADPYGENYAYLGTNNPVSVQRVRANLFGFNLYAYDYITLTETLRAIGGVAFTHQEFPENAESPPITGKQERGQQWNPKAGLVWSPATWTDLRGSYTRSLTGLGLGQSARLEPTHVAGLLQTFRAVVPPSLVGELNGLDLETAEVVWEVRLPDTFLSAGWQRLHGEKTRQVGLYLTQPIDTHDLPPERGLLRERIDFTENSFDVSARRLLSEEWSFGVRYKLAMAELERSFPEYRPQFVSSELDARHEEAWLHTIELSALYRHASGVFAQADANWFSQVRRATGANPPGDDSWQLNLKAGYRFPNQRAQVTLGVLNITGTDYRLSPMNAHAEQPRSRTFYAQFLVNF